MLNVAPLEEFLDMVAGLNMAGLALTELLSFPEAEMAETAVRAWKSFSKSGLGSASDPHLSRSRELFGDNQELRRLHRAGKVA